MIFQLWSYPIPLTIYPSSRFSPPSPIPFYNPFYRFLSILCFLSSPILNHMFSHPYVAILSLVLSVLTTNENFQKVFTSKTNLLCNPTKVAIMSPLEVKKNVTFLSQPKQSIYTTIYTDFPIHRHTFTLSICLHILEYVLSLFSDDQFK
jgi:hypothetical protein